MSTHKAEEGNGEGACLAGGPRKAAEAAFVRVPFLVRELWSPQLGDGLSPGSRRTAVFDQADGRAAPGSEVCLRKEGTDAAGGGSLMLLVGERPGSAAAPARLDFASPTT
jgi:hypothetical protein